MFCGGLYHQQLDEAKKSHADVLICGYLWFNSPFLIMFVDMTMIFLSDIQIIVQWLFWVVPKKITMIFAGFNPTFP